MVIMCTQKTVITCMFTLYSEIITLCKKYVTRWCITVVYELLYKCPFDKLHNRCISYVNWSLCDGLTPVVHTTDMCILEEYQFITHLLHGVI